MQLGFSAPQVVLDTLATIGRTEDIRLSPNRRRLALTAITREQIALFDIAVQRSAAGKQVHLTGVQLLSSEHLQYPHGIDFLDDETVAVANREGDLCLFRLPAPGTATNQLQLLQRFGADTLELQGPGSIVAAALDGRRHELLVCRNIGHRISRHVVAADNGYAIEEEGLLLGKWLQVPDGIGIGQRWLAVSSHNTQSGLLYAFADAPTPESDPAAVLRGATFPHGVRISADDDYVLMADAGAPYVHIYLQPGGQWRGVYDPDLSLQVMDEALFRQGSAGNPQEGGPKGLDIDPDTGILVTTCAAQPLAFFDLEQVLADAGQGSPSRPASASRDTTLDVHLELERQQRLAQNFTDLIYRERQAALATESMHQAAYQAAQALERSRECEGRALHAEALLAEMGRRSDYFEARTKALLTSSSWHLTAPLRRLLKWRSQA